MEADIRVDANLELVKQMGSKQGYDPIPPSQYLYFLDDPDPVQRVVAYVRSRTIRKGHRSVHAVHKDGRVVTMQDLADDCFGGHWANANRAWGQAEAQKLVAKNKKGELCLSGSVPSRESQRKSLENQRDPKISPLCTEWRSKGEEWSKVCAEWSPPNYIREKIEQLSEKDRESFAVQYREVQEWGATLEADAIAAARAERDKREKLLLSKVGIEPRNGGKKRDLNAKPLCVQLTLISDTDILIKPAEESVQNHSVQNGPESVQSGKNDLYRVVNESVQSRHVIDDFAKAQRSSIAKEESSSSAVSLAPPPAKAEEEEPSRLSIPAKTPAEEPYATFERLYPSRMWDPAKAKPIFRKLNPKEQRNCIERLQVYLKSESWTAENGHWVPLASNWLKSDYNCEPPPLIRPAARRTRKSKTDMLLDEAFGASGDD